MWRARCRSLLPLPRSTPVPRCPLGGYFSRFSDHEDNFPEPVAPEPVAYQAASNLFPQWTMCPRPARSPASTESFAKRQFATATKPSASAKTPPRREPTSAGPLRTRATASPRSRPATRGSRGGPPTRGRVQRADSQAATAIRQTDRATASRQSVVGQAQAQRVGGWRESPALPDEPARYPRSAAPRKESRTEARGARSNRTPALTAGAKAGNSKRYGFTAQAEDGRTSGDESDSPATTPKEDHCRHRRAGGRREEYHCPAPGPSFRPPQPRDGRDVPRLRAEGTARTRFRWTTARRWKSLPARTSSAWKAAATRTASFWTAKT